MNFNIGLGIKKMFRAKGFCGRLKLKLPVVFVKRIEHVSVLGRLAISYVYVPFRKHTFGMASLPRVVQYPFETIVAVYAAKVKRFILACGWRNFMS